MDSDLNLKTEAGKRMVEKLAELGDFARQHGFPFAAMTVVEQDVYASELNIAPEMHPILARNPQPGAGLFHAAMFIAAGQDGEVPADAVAVMMEGPTGGAG